VRESKRKVMVIQRKRRLKEENLLTLLNKEMIRRKQDVIVSARKIKKESNIRVSDRDEEDSDEV
jgi:hypothetical protein